MSAMWMSLWQWVSIQEIFKDCIAMEKTGATPSKEKYGGPGLYA